MRFAPPFDWKVSGGFPSSSRVSRVVCAVAALAAAELMTCTGYMSVYWASNAARAACSAPVVHQLKISTCPETTGALMEPPPLQPALNTTAPTNGGNHPNRDMSIMLLTWPETAFSAKYTVRHAADCRFTFSRRYPKIPRPATYGGRGLASVWPEVFVLHGASRPLRPSGPRASPSPRAWPVRPRARRWCTSPCHVTLGR